MQQTQVVPLIFLELLSDDSEPIANRENEVREKVTSQDEFILKVTSQEQAANEEEEEASFDQKDSEKLGDDITDDDKWKKSVAIKTVTGNHCQRMEKLPVKEA